LIDAVGNIAHGPGGGVYHTCREQCSRVKHQLSRIAAEVVISEVTPLRTELEGMAATNIAQGITHHKRGVATPLGKAPLIAKSQTSLTRLVSNACVSDTVRIWR
jgi:hypothetical protein